MGAPAMSCVVIFMDLAASSGRWRTGIVGALGLPLWLSWKRIHLQCGRPGFNLWVGKIPWRRGRLPTPVFWPREFRGLYSPWGHKESDMTERLSLGNWRDGVPDFTDTAPRLPVPGGWCMSYLPWFYQVLQGCGLSAIGLEAKILGTASRVPQVLHLCVLVHPSLGVQISGILLCSCILGRGTFWSCRFFTSRLKRRKKDYLSLLSCRNLSYILFLCCGFLLLHLFSIVAY